MVKETINVPRNYGDFLYGYKKRQLNYGKFDDAVDRVGLFPDNIKKKRQIMYEGDHFVSIDSPTNYNYGKR